MAPTKPKPDDRDPKTGQFLTGENWAGNRNGRPKGSARRELAREFIEALQKSWTEHGDAVLEHLVKEDPAALLRAMVAILPKELDVNVNRYDEMSIEQLRAEFVAAVREARALGIDIKLDDEEGVH